MPLLSIVTTVYDRADALSSCLRSVANLDWQDYEHIIVADHPPEDAFAALERVVAETGDARVSLCNLPERTNDLGISPAQAGLRKARGKYVAFLDDDNVYLPGHFNALIDCLESNPGLGFAYSACLWNAELLLNAPSPAEGRIDLGQVLFRRDVFQTHLGDQLKYSGYTWDWQLIADLLSRGVSFRFIDQETFVFRAAQFPRLKPEAPLESARKRIDELARAAQHARREFAEAMGQAQEKIVGLMLHAEHVAQQAARARQDLEREHDRLSHAHRDLEHECQQLAKAHQGLQGEHDRLSHAHHDLEHECQQLAKAHQELQGEHHRLSCAYRNLEQEREQLAKVHQQLQYRLDSVLASRIWRWMAPLRALLNALGGGS
jgi:hypothetical protein